MAEIITLTVKQVGVSEAEKSLNNMLTTIKAINSTPINVSVTGSGAKAAEQYKEAVTVTQTEVKKLSQSFKDTEKSGDSLLKNVIKNAQWYYISGAVSAATRSFKDAIAAMKEADAEMISIQKVTGYTKDQMDRLSDSAYALASAYGRTAQEILSAETTFARAGYTDQIENLAELAVLTQNVGDVNADTASKFLIAADAAWKLGGNEKELTEIIDGMNDVIRNVARKAPQEIKDTVLGEDGFLYCTKCGGRRQREVDLPDGSTMKVSFGCKCKKEEWDAEDAERKKKEEAMRISSLRTVAFQDSSQNMLYCTFDNDDGARPDITSGMKKYCENFSELRKSGKGILLYGSVGTGKSFFAACIVNELVSKGYRCMMTTFSRLANQIGALWEDKQEFIDDLTRYDLLAIDVKEAVRV